MRERPVVDLVTPLPAEEVLARFAQRLIPDDRPCDGHVGRRELSLLVREADRHVFSPWLSLEVTPGPEGTEMRGHFGPHPNLWSLFVALYATQVFVFLGGTMFGWVQLQMGDPPIGLLYAGAALLGLACSCGVDLAGRRAGAPQMQRVRAFIHDVVDVAPQSPQGRTGRS
ncbi:MAG: hypothetical protein R3F59_12755 [Myxococcota bacterium]